MNKEEFAAGVTKSICYDSARSVIEVLTKPPGRKPWREEVELSKWYLALSAEDKEKVAKVAAMAAHAATFGFLATLDGVGSIQGQPSEGRFELRFIEGETSTLLNDDNEGDFLHDMLPQPWTR